MNSNKNNATKKDTVALIGLGPKGLVVNPGVKPEFIVNACLNAVMTITANTPIDDVVRLFNTAIATRDPEIVFGSKEYLEKQRAEEDAALVPVENETVDAEIEEIKAKLQEHIDAESES